MIYNMNFNIVASKYFELYLVCFHFSIFSTRGTGQFFSKEEASFLFSPGPMPTMEMANRLYSSRELAHFPRSDTLSRPSEAQSTHLSTGKAVSHLKGATVRGGNYSFGKR